MVRSAAERSAPRFRAERVTVLPGPNLRGPGPDRPLRRAARRRAHRPHRRRPGRDRAAEPAAGGRARRAWPASGTGSAGRSSACAGPRPRPCARPSGLTPVEDPQQRRPRPPPQPGAPRDPAPARRRRRPRRGAGPRRRQAELLGEERTCSTGSPATLDPTDAPGPAGRPPALARRAIRAWLWRAMGGRPPRRRRHRGPGAGGRPPRRGGAADVQDGWRVARAEGRLHLDRRATIARA